MNVRGMDHVGVLVPDFTQVRTLVAILGLEADPAEELPELGIEFMFVSISDTRLEFIRPVSDDSRVATTLAAGQGGVHHIAFRVDDVLAALDEAQRAGCVLRDTVARVGVHGSQIGFIEAGPVLVEFVQPAAPPGCATASSFPG